jgi:ATP-binding cassette subfamily B protein
VGFGLGAWLVADFFARTGARDPGAGLLAVYWALSLPMLGYELALFVQQVPGQRSLTLRLVEPLGAPKRADEGHARRSTARPWREDGDARFDPLRAFMSWSEALGPLDVTRSHLAGRSTSAIVGASGAGKSTQQGLLLLAPSPLGQPSTSTAARWAPRSWTPCATHGVGRSDGVTCGTYRRRNLTFGSAAPSDEHARAVRTRRTSTSDTAGLPRGAETPLGEAGGLLSGGEGQRVRFGRGVLRPRPALVLLDEPFRGLSREQRRPCWRARAPLVGRDAVCA